jgi:MerR family transcriptional regulator/heat shock protein HspR
LSSDVPKLDQASVDQAVGAAEASGGRRGSGQIDLDKPLYVISVAAELVDMHPQTLRLYERKGLIEPSRSAGKTRLYSQRNIDQLREIRRLTQELGVNLSGVEEIIRLRARLDQLQNSMEGRITNLQSQLRDHLDSLRGRQLPAPVQDDEDDSREHGEGGGGAATSDS